MTYKIVFFDVDGTITNEQDGSISKSTKDAIKDLLNSGIKVVAATGRPLSMCSELMELGIETFITANGGYVTHNTEMIHKITVDRETIQQVVEFANKKGNALSYYTEGFSMNGVEDPIVLNAIKETLSLNEYPPKNPNIHNEEVYLLCLFVNDDALDEYINLFPHLTFKRWHPYVVNVLQHDVSKSIAALKVLDYFNIDRAQAVAFGDGENDIDMLELVGLSIAMGNGNKKLKEIADFVTKKSSEDGIEFALKKYGIIQNTNLQLLV